MSPATAPEARALVVIGGRPDGHGRVVMETAQEIPGTRVLGFLDDSPKAATVAGVPHLGRVADWRVHAERGAEFHIAIGDNRIRRRLADEIVAGGGRLGSVVHPAARIAASAFVGEGSLVCPGAVLCPGARVGRDCIVNHGVIVEHDGVLRDHVNLSTGTVTGGRVTFGEGVFAGVGVRVIPDVVVGDWCVLGAGAVVVRATEAGGTYVGVPARLVKRNSG